MNIMDKHKQLQIILQTNPCHDEYHTWIRTVDDIKTFEEALSDPDYADCETYDPDYNRNNALTALKTNKITVYSSYPIKQGIFVTPSKLEALSYSANNMVYSKSVQLTDVAWIDITQGQYVGADDISS
ncbi:hypothetical protein J6A31_04550 [bacterium]|nr:hypothetical protein [bacterium]